MDAEYNSLTLHRHPKRLLWIILGMALLLRLIFVAWLPSTVNPGADSGWYLGNGYALVTGKQPPGFVTDVSQLASPPVYFIILGIPQAFLSTDASVLAVRVFQALLSTATCYFAFRLALLLTRRPAAGLIAACALAISPAFIIESAQILTETTYIFLISGGMWLYVEGVKSTSERKLKKAPASIPAPHPLTPSPREPNAGSRSQAERGGTLHALMDEQQARRGMALLLLAAALFGLATLTRAVLLVFPLALAAYLLIMRQGWRRAALFLLVYMLVVSSWTVYSVVRWNRFVIAGTGFDAMVYVGAAGWSSPQGVDQALAQQQPGSSYAQAAGSIIRSDPVGWVKRRVSELAGAYLQPHGTTFYPGASLRDLALNWLQEDRSAAGLVALTRGDAFWPKVVLYAMHYIALVAGVIGIWLERRHWRIALPLVGFIGYLTLVHLALLALPRYLFPNEIFWWVFAAAALSRLLVRRRESLKG